MRITLVLAMLVFAVGLGGCACGAMGTSGCDGCEASNLRAGCLPKAMGNSCGWDFYVPADMIEGRQQRDCVGTSTYYPGQVVSRSYAVPVQSAPSTSGPMLIAPAEVPPPTVR